MNWFIIELVGNGRRTFVESFSNTRASPVTCFTQGQAKVFGSMGEAQHWISSYLPGYNAKVIGYDPAATCEGIGHGH